MPEPPRETISGTVVKDTDDGTEYELQPTELGQIRLQRPDADPESDPTTLDPEQLLHRYRNGELYFPNGVSGIRDAVEALRGD